MRIDSGHRPWILATLALAIPAQAFWLWYWWQSPAGLSGGTVIGQWYGIIGLLLMLVAAALAGLRYVPSWWWLGRRTLWLRAHIWLGLLSTGFILWHSGFRLGGPVEQVLWLLLVLTVTTGFLGLALQHALPGLLAVRVPCEAPYEQLPYLYRVLRERADAVVIRAADDSRLDQQTREQLRQFYDGEVRPFLDCQGRPSQLDDPLHAQEVFARVRTSPALAPAAPTLDQLAELCEQRRRYRLQERLHHWLHGWLFVHVPLSILLLVLGIAHALMSVAF